MHLRRSGWDGSTSRNRTKVGLKAAQIAVVYMEETTRPQSNQGGIESV